MRVSESGACARALCVCECLVLLLIHTSLMIIKLTKLEETVHHPGEESNSAEALKKLHFLIILIEGPSVYSLRT